MDKDGKNPEQKYSNVKFEILLMGYHTSGLPIFVIEDPLLRVSITEKCAQYVQNQTLILEETLRR